jgi:hypothetical protein
MSSPSRARPKVTVRKLPTQPAEARRRSLSYSWPLERKLRALKAMLNVVRASLEDSTTLTSPRYTPPKPSSKRRPTAPDRFRALERAEGARTHQHTGETRMSQPWPTGRAFLYTGRPRTSNGPDMNHFLSLTDLVSKRFPAKLPLISLPCRTTRALHDSTMGVDPNESPCASRYWRTIVAEFARASRAHHRDRMPRTPRCESASRSGDLSTEMLELPAYRPLGR